MRFYTYLFLIICWVEKFAVFVEKVLLIIYLMQVKKIKNKIGSVNHSQYVI